MNIISHTPTYNLKVVLKETGLNASVLRAWERRYGLPVPQRSAGGHRLYSSYEIETIKWLKTRQAEGLSISQAVDLWKELTNTGRDPVAETRLTSFPPQQAALAASNTSLEMIRRSWVEACLAFDETTADQVLNQAFAVYPVEVVCTEVLQGGINDFGEGWSRGKASVQQEHFASSLAMRRLEALIAANPQPTRPQKILVGCPPGEWHTFSALLINLLLRRRGFEVIYLGAHVPLEQLEETARALRPTLIILVAQQLITAASLLSIAINLYQAGFPLAYGGRIFNLIPQMRQRIPAHFLGESLEKGVQKVEALTTSSALPPLVDSRFDQASVTNFSPMARQFRAKRSQIETTLYNDLSERDPSINNIENANLALGNSLTAALELGDIAYLAVDLPGIKQSLAGHGMSSDTFALYLATYSRAARRILGQGGAAISDSLDHSGL